MLNDNLIDIFDACVSRLEQGETIEDCLQSYPQYASILHPMLEATRIPKQAQAPLDEVVQAQARVGEQFEQALNQPVRLRPSFSLSRIAAMVAVIFFVGSLLTTGVVIAAQDAIPGDSLYGVKRFSEQVRLTFASDDTTLREEFAQRRIDETKKVIELGRETVVEFGGVIESIDENILFVSGFYVDVQPDIRTVNLMIGMRVQLIAQTYTDHRIIATDIQIQELAQPLIPLDITPDFSLLTPTDTLPTITPTITLEPTRITATYTATLSPTIETRATTTDVPTREVTSTLIPTVRPTQTHTPIATATSETCLPSLPDGWTTYTIQAGDTPSGIAVGTDLSLDELYTVNCDLDPTLIVAGDVIYVPYTPRLATTATLTATTESQPLARPTLTPAVRPQQSNQQTRPTATEASSSRDRERERQRQQNDDDEEEDNSGGRGR